MRVAALLLLVACGSSPPAATAPAPQSAEALAIESVIAAWSERGDLPRTNETELRGILILDAADTAHFREYCAAGAGECAPIHNRCTGPAGMACGFDRLVVVEPGPIAPARRLALIRHGAIHHAAAAADIHDPTHHDPRLWPYVCRRAGDAECVRESVEERAAGRGPN